MSIREQMIAAGVIRPARPGDPSEQPWRDAPTLPIDAAGAAEAKKVIAKPLPEFAAEKALIFRLNARRRAA